MRSLALKMRNFTCCNVTSAILLLFCCQVGAVLDYQNLQLSTGNQEVRCYLAPNQPLVASQELVTGGFCYYRGGRLTPQGRLMFPKEWRGSKGWARISEAVRGILLPDDGLWLSAGRGNFTLGWEDSLSLDKACVNTHRSFVVLTPVQHISNIFHYSAAAVSLLSLQSSLEQYGISSNFSHYTLVESDGKRPYASYNLLLRELVRRRLKPAVELSAYAHMTMDESSPHFRSDSLDTLACAEFLTFSIGGGNTISPLWFLRAQDQEVFRRDLLQLADEGRVVPARPGDLLPSVQYADAGVVMNPPILRVLIVHRDIRGFADVGDVTALVSSILTKDLNVSSVVSVAQLEYMNAVEQVWTMKDAHMVISVHGAQYAHMAYLPRCSMYMEIIPNQYLKPGAYYLAKASRHVIEVLYGTVGTTPLNSNCLSHLPHGNHTSHTECLHDAKCWSCIRSVRNKAKMLLKDRQFLRDSLSHLLSMRAECFNQYPHLIPYMNHVMTTQFKNAISSREATLPNEGYVRVREMRS